MLILIHYGEIGLKKGNRAFFERKLVENIQAALKDCGDFLVTRETGYITVFEKNNDMSGGAPQIAEKLKKVFGIAHFSFANEIRINPDANLDKICAEIYKLYGNFAAAKKYKKFKIEAKRSDKAFPFNSQEINKEVGAFIAEKTKMKVDLENTDLTIFIEITRKSIYVYFEKIKGPGGLPVGTNGEVLALISSGIDSPVAAWYLMKRGAQANFVHFHSYPQTNKASIDNVREIISRLNKWQKKNCKLFLIPLLGIQNDIIKKSSEDYRVIMYRHFMLLLAEKIALDNNYKALVTGESLGQVASQTIDNIFALNNVLNMPIFRPLIGFDKEEIINKAKEIGTYEMSIRPYGDCCSFFVPKHPVTRADTGIISKIAGTIDRKIVEQTLNNIEIIHF